MKGRWQLVLCCLAIAGAPLGCTTMTVRRVPRASASVVGVRYALPRLFLQQVKKESGQMVFEPLYLPDGDRTYAIDSSTFAGNYTLNIESKGGLLTKVEWKPDSSGAPTKAVTAAGDITKGIVDARIARQTQIAGKEKAVADAELAFDLAKIRYETAAGDANVSAADKLTAWKEWRQAEINLKAAENALGNLVGRRPQRFDDTELPPPPVSGPNSGSAGLTTTTAPSETPATIYIVTERPGGYVALQRVSLPPGNP